MWDWWGISHCFLLLYSNGMSINYTYEGNTMYLYTLKVLCNIDITWVEHICESNHEFIHCLLSFYRLDVYYFLMKAMGCICTQ